MAASTNGDAKVRLWWAAALALVPIFLGVIVVTYPADVNHDVAMYVHAALMILDGKVPYVDLVDMNPPLIMYLSIPAAVISILTGAPAGTCFQLMVVLGIAFTAWLIEKLLAGIRPDYSAGDRGVIVAGWMLAHLSIWAQSDFGQREQIIMLLYFPFLLLRLGRARSVEIRGDWAAGLGMLAGIGLGIKPHYLLVAATIEGLVLIARRPRRLTAPLRDPEVIGAAVILAAYAAHWLVVPATMRTEFFERWVPTVVSGYSAFNADDLTLLRKLLHDEKMLFPLAPVLLLAALAIRHPARLLLAAFGAGGLMSIVIFLVQHKGWPYHQIPAQIFTAVSVAVLVVEMGRTIDPSRWMLPPRLVCGIGLVLVASPILVSGEKTMRGREAHRKNVEYLLKEQTWPGDGVLALSTMVAFGYPMMLTHGLHPGSRYLHHFPLALIYHRHPPAPGGPLYRKREEAPPEENRYLDELMADIREERPEVILITDVERPQGCPPGFNLHAYLKHNGFLEAMLQQGYVESLRTMPGFARVYLRSR